MFYFQNSQQLDPEESFAWKDSTLDRKLKELEERAKKQSESRSSEINGFDKNIDKSIGNWSNLPKAPNPDVILLKKARGMSTIYKDRIIHYIKCDMLSKSLNWELGLVHYIVKFTILRFVISKV